jgi:hypothetical protein
VIEFETAQSVSRSVRGTGSAPARLLTFPLTLLGRADEVIE